MDNNEVVLCDFDDKVAYIIGDVYKRQREGCVDPVSLACTFKGNEDERIEMSIEKLLEEL